MDKIAVTIVAAFHEEATTHRLGGRRARPAAACVFARRLARAAQPPAPALAAVPGRRRAPRCTAIRPGAHVGADGRSARLAARLARRWMLCVAASPSASCSRHSCASLAGTDA